MKPGNASFSSLFTKLIKRRPKTYAISKHMERIDFILKPLCHKNTSQGTWNHFLNSN